MKHDCNSTQSQSPTEVEGACVCLKFIVDLVMDDFLCWIHFNENPSGALYLKDDVPLIARLLWQPKETIIGQTSQAVRDLKKFHITALVMSKN